MSSLKRRYRNFKKAKANPYAGRGLDKFALVTAELEAKRKKLAAELDTPLSMVKFAIGAHNRWVPIILSRSTRKESRLAVSSRANTDGLGSIKEAKLRLSRLVCENGGHGKDVAQSGVRPDSGHMGSNVDRQDSHVNGSMAENTDTLSRLVGEDAFLVDALHKEGLFHTNVTFTEDRLHVDALLLKKTRTLGNPIGMGIEQEVSDDVLEFFSTASETEHIATYKEEEEDAVVQGRNLKKLIGAIAGIPWVVSKASTIASSVVFLKWYAKPFASEGKTLSPKRPILRDNIEELHAAELPVSVSSVPSLDTSDVLSLPSPPAPLNFPGIRITSEQDDIVEIMEDSGAPHLETANKQHRKCKVKGLLKIRSAPSTPRDSRKPKESFTAASTFSKTLGVNGQAIAAHVKEEDLLAPRATKPQSKLKKCHFPKDSDIGARKERARRAGHALAAAGLVLSLSGLTIGYLLAIVGVVCWWYVLPSLRKAVGDRPAVRSHHHGHVNNKILTPANAQAKVKKISKEVGSGNSQQYKKKVIMEGLLDRGRRSNS